MNHPSKELTEKHLRTLDAATHAPADVYDADEDVRDAFDSELRQLAEDIVRYHPSLTQLLLSLGSGSQRQATPFLAGSN